MLNCEIKYCPIFLVEQARYFSFGACFCFTKTPLIIFSCYKLNKLKITITKLHKISVNYAYKWYNFYIKGG